MAKEQKRPYPHSDGENLTISNQNQNQITKTIGDEYLYMQVLYL